MEDEDMVTNNVPIGSKRKSTYAEEHPEISAKKHELSPENGASKADDLNDSFYDESNDENLEQALNESNEVVQMIERLADDPTVQPFTPVVSRKRGPSDAEQLSQTLSGFSIPSASTTPIRSQFSQGLSQGEFSPSNFSSASTFFRMARELKEAQEELKKKDQKIAELQEIIAKKDELLERAKNSHGAI